jgi:hypothetical protein
MAKGKWESWIQNLEATGGHNIKLPETPEARERRLEKAHRKRRAKKLAELGMTDELVEQGAKELRERWEKNRRG